MATQPHPTPKPPPPKPPEDDDAAKSSGDAQVDKIRLAEEERKRNPPDPPVETVADEQRKRSEEIDEMGVERWKAAHDERKGDERRQIPGVAKTDMADEDRRSKAR
jgi:hypothetical protein